LLTSAMMPTLMVVAVSPMSVPGPADPAGEAAWVAAAEAGAVDEEAADGVLPLLLLEALQPAASRTAASAATTARRRARAGNGRLTRLPAPPGLSLLAVTLVPSTTSLPVSFEPCDTRPFTTKVNVYRAVGIKIEADLSAGDSRCHGRMQTSTSRRSDIDLYLALTGGCKSLPPTRRGAAGRNAKLYRGAILRL
jgi:hypothetical protein